MPRKPWLALLLLTSLIGIYFGAAAYILHFNINRLLFPTMSGVVSAEERLNLGVYSASGNELLVRKYGTNQLGCAVFFPGQHGGIRVYEQQLFPNIVAAGIAVFSISYPGQDAARGRAYIEETQELIEQALADVGKICAKDETIFLGRSLGATVAAYAAQKWHPQGLLLDGVAPSLSSAVFSHLQAKWYLAPLSVLPIHWLLIKDYSLFEVLKESSPMQVAIFQGTADVQTPLEALRTMQFERSNIQVYPVVGGTHSDTYLLVMKQYIATAVNMLHNH